MNTNLHISLKFQDVTAVEPLLLISTLDGALHAVNKKDGLVKWKLDEDPVLNVPMESTTTIKGLVQLHVELLKSTVF